MSEDVFIQAYDDYSDALFRYCYFRVYDREKALELVQETFTKAWVYVKDNQDKEIENFRAFLYRVAKNLIIDNARRNKKRPTSSLDDLREAGFDPGTDPTGAMKNLLDNKSALTVIEQLPDKYREVVWLRYLEDMSVKEIALMLEDSENNVSVKIHRALSKLRQLIPDHNG